LSWLSDPQIWIGLVTLTALEIVLGIDNIVFISILAGKLPKEEQAKARKVGLALALAWIVRLTKPLFVVYGLGISGRDLILIFGGLFLLAKATHEIHAKLEGAPEDSPTAVRGRATFASVVTQIMFLDIVFSLDSVITAVGMVNNIPVMVTAVVIAIIVMMIFVNPVSAFVDHHPTVKMLALSFLVLIGVTLLAEGLHQHIPKGYIYFAMFYSLSVEMLNLKMRSRHARGAVNLFCRKTTRAPRPSVRGGPAFLLLTA
jgi:predicted tellurium resistance membrane protein TerC